MNQPNYFSDESQDTCCSRRNYSGNPNCESPYGMVGKNCETLRLPSDYISIRYRFFHISPRPKANDNDALGPCIPAEKRSPVALVDLVGT